MKLRRIVTLLAVALVLGTMLALGALAEDVAPFSITTEDGKITSGLDFENYTYKITPVRLADSATPKLFRDHYVDFLPDTAETVSVKVPSSSQINPETGNKYPGYENISVYKYQTSNEQVANEKSTVTYYALETYYTQIANKNLAGLYKIKRFDKTTGAVAGDAITFYVKGTKADRQAIASKGILPDNNSNNTSEAGNRWNYGYMSTIAHTQHVKYLDGFTNIVPGSHKGWVAGYTNIAFVQNHTTNGVHYTDPAILIRDGEITKDDYAAACALFSFKYALQQHEIIPTTEFNSFTYGVSRSGTIEVGSTDTKLLVLVYDSTAQEGKEFKTFEKIDDVKTAETKTEYNSLDEDFASSKHTVYADELESEDGTKLSELGADNYIIGYEVFPAVNVNANTLVFDDKVSANTYVAPGSGQNTFRLTIYHSEYDIDVETEATPTGIAYNAKLNKLTGLTGGRNYYVAPYDVTGMYSDSAVKLTVDANGTASVPDGIKGLVAVFVKSDYKYDSAPFILWTPSDEAGTFYNAEQSAYYGAEGETGADLLVPGKFYGPKIPAMTDFKIVKFTSGGTGLGFHLRGYTVGSKLGTNDDDGYEIFPVSGDHEALIPQVGIYYGFRSAEAFPIERFEGFNPKSTGTACQGASTPAYITYDNGETLTKVVRAINGNTYQGDLVLYYVDSYGKLGSYTIKGTLQNTLTFTNNVYMPTQEDKVALEELRGNYIVGYALLPYATVNYAQGQTSLFTNYTNSGGFVYINILNQDGHAKGLNVELRDFIGIATGKDGVITVPDSTKNYLISPVTLKDEVLDGYNMTGTGGTASVATITADVWTKLDATTNQELAGLYKICEADAKGNCISLPSYVYVNGKADDVQAIATTATGVDNTVGTKWRVGVWVGIGYNGNVAPNSDIVSINTEKGYVTSVHGSHKAQVYGEKYKKIFFVSNSVDFPNPAVLIGYGKDTDTSNDSNAITEALYAEAVGKYSMKYALTAKEIIPTTMFNSFTYGLSRQGSIDVGETNTKLQVLVYNANAEVFETYEAIASNKTSATMGSANNPTSKHTITADELTLVGGETKLSALGDGYYIMGYEVFPAVNVAGDDLEILNTTTANQFFTYIYYNEYDIDVPMFEKPNASFDAETGKVTISNYDSNVAYGIAPITFNLPKTLDGSAISNAIELSAVETLTLDNGEAALSGRVGLFGIVALGDGYTLGSEDYSLIYIKPSDDTLKQLGTINPNDSKKVLFERSYEWIAGTWSGAELIWTNAGNTNDGNRFLFRDEFSAFSTNDAQKMWLFQNTSDYVTKLITDEKEMAAEKIEYFNNNINSTDGSLTDAEKALTAEQYVYWNGKITRGSYDEDLLDAAVADHYAAYPESGTDAIYTNEGYVSFMETALTPYKDRHIQYLMTQDEIIPARDLVSMKMMTYKEQGAISIGAFKSRLVVYVLQGDTIVPVEFVDEKTYSTASRQDHEYDLSEKLANMDGYVVALRFYPWSDIDINTVTVTPGLILSNSNSYRFTRTTPGAGYYLDGYRIKERIAAPVAELVEGGDAITVADPNAEYEYLYKAVGDAEWKALDEENIGIFDKAGTKYVVKIADGKYCYESPESNEVTSHGFVATGTSLLLSGDIGIKTTFDVSDAVAFEDLKFFDTATGDEVEVVKDANSVTIYVPAKDKTKNFEYRYGNDVIRSVSTIANYIDNFTSNDAEEKALVNALDNYTDYSAVYFGVDGATASGALSDALASVELKEEEKPSVDFKNSIEGFEYLGAALILEGKTAIRHYFKAYDTATAYTVKIDGETVDYAIGIDIDNECYYVDVTDVAAENYDKLYTVEITDGNKINTISYSVMNYLVNNVNKEGKEALVNLVKAMYDYHAAVKAYANN